MRAKLKYLVIICLAAVLLVFGTALTLNAPVVTAWVLGAGGQRTENSSLVVNSTVGQSIIGLSTSGNIVLSSGYWQGHGAASTRTYLPLITK